jgi:hypothetical protein
MPQSELSHDKSGLRGGHTISHPRPIHCPLNFPSRFSLAREHRSRLIEPLRKSCPYVFKTCSFLGTVVNPNTNNQSLFHRILTGVRHTEVLPRKNIKQIITRGYSLMNRDFVATLEIYDSNYCLPAARYCLFNIFVTTSVPGDHCPPDTT